MKRILLYLFSIHARASLILLFWFTQMQFEIRYFVYFYFSSFFPFVILIDFLIYIFVCSFLWAKTLKNKFKIHSISELYCSRAKKIRKLILLSNNLLPHFYLENRHFQINYLNRFVCAYTSNKSISLLVFFSRLSFIGLKKIPRTF